MENLLQANEISCRVQQISEKGLSLLLYVTSRDGQKRLDEKFGELGWQDRYEVIDGDLYCIISVWDSEKKMWISKEDVGTASYTAKEKGRASDAFKRACVKHGTGVSFIQHHIYGFQAIIATLRRTLTEKRQREISFLSIGSRTLQTGKLMNWR